MLATLCCIAAGAASSPEQALLAGSYGMAFRPGPGTLCIVTTLGDTVSFSDDMDTGYILEDFRIHTLVARLPEQDYWVVHQAGYEWTGWILVNGSDGRSVEAISMPIPSPDGNRLLCASQDIMAGFVENGIQIWQVQPGGLVLEFHDLTMQWGPENASWESDSAIVLDMLVYDWELGEAATYPTRLELVQGVWTPGSDW